MAQYIWCVYYAQEKEVTMPTMCIQCAMKALLEGKTPEHFDEEPEAHMRRVHPDPEATQRERQELERALSVKLGGTVDPTKS